MVLDPKIYHGVQLNHGDFGEIHETTSKAKSAYAALKPRAEER